MGINIPNESETEIHPLLQSQLEPNTDNSLIQQTCLESKKLWHIAAPSIFSRLTMFSITVVTQSFAGHLNDLDLAAISIACTLLIAITFGFLVYHFIFFFTFSIYLFIQYNIFKFRIIENVLGEFIV
jgi:MATE family multidrug resistance protein